MGIRGCGPVLGSVREVFNLLLLSFIYPITDRDCVVLPFINVQTSTLPKDEVVVARPPDHNGDTRGLAIFVAAAASIQPPPPPTRLPLP